MILEIVSTYFFAEQGEFYKYLPPCLYSFWEKQNEYIYYLD